LVLNPVFEQFHPPIVPNDRFVVLVTVVVDTAARRRRHFPEVTLSQFGSASGSLLRSFSVARLQKQARTEEQCGPRSG
jgi:hypothetical protein